MSWWIKGAMIFFSLLLFSHCQKKKVDPLQMDRVLMQLADEVKKNYMREVNLEASKKWLKKAMGLYRSLEQAKRETVVLDYLIAWHYYNAHAYKAAEIRLEKVQSQDPYFKYQYHLRYLLLKEMKANKKWFALCLEALKQYHPDSHVYEYFQTDYLLYEGDYEQANEKASLLKTRAAMPAYLKKYIEEIEVVSALLLNANKKKVTYQKLIALVKTKTTDLHSEEGILGGDSLYVKSANFLSEKEIKKHIPEKDYLLYRFSRQSSQETKPFEEVLNIYFCLNKENPYYFLANSEVILSGANVIQILSLLP